MTQESGKTYFNGELKNSEELLFNAIKDELGPDCEVAIRKIVVEGEALDDQYRSDLQEIHRFVEDHGEDALVNTLVGFFDQFVETEDEDNIWTRLNLIHMSQDIKVAVEKLTSYFEGCGYEHERLSAMVMATLRQMSERGFKTIAIPGDESVAPGADYRISEIPILSVVHDIVTVDTFEATWCSDTEAYYLSSKQYEALC